MSVEVIVHPYLLGRNDVSWVSVLVDTTPTVRDCILALGNLLPSLNLNKVMGEDGELRPNIYLMLNHKDLPEEGLSARMKDGDCLRLVYIMSGCC